MNRKTLFAGLLTLAVAVAAYVLWQSRGGPVSFGDIKSYAIVQSLEAPELVLIDMSDDSLAGTVTLPEQPDQVLVSAEVERIVYSNRATRTVSVYDLASQSVEARIELPFVPDNIVRSPDGISVAAAGNGGVAVIRLDEPGLIATVNAADGGTNMAFSNDSGHLFVSDSAASQITVIDAISGQVLEPIALEFDKRAGGPGQMALSALTRTPNGLYGVVVDAPSGLMSVINFRHWLEIDAIRLGANPSRPYGTADGQFMLVANTDDRTVSIISTEYFDVVATLPGVSSVTGISTGYFETLALVVSDTENKAVMIDLEKMEPAGEIQLAGTPGPSVTDVDGRKIYVALSDRNELVVIDAIDRKVLKTISNVGHRPWSVSLAQSNNYCH